MKIGICAAANHAQTIADVGADYIELGVGTTLAAQEADGWDEKRAALRALPLPIETFNLFLPRDFHLTGEPDAVTDTDTVRRYVFTALRRAREVGASVIVFGSGGQRRVPDGVSRTVAADQLRGFLRICAEASDETGVVIAVEPLNRKESNIINSVAEAVGDYAAVLAHPGIRVVADTYHMERENEPLAVLHEHAAFIAHVHTADTNRVPPGQGTYDHAALFSLLREIGYTGRVSVEATFNDLPAEVADVMRHLRRAEGVSPVEK